MTQITAICLALLQLYHMRFLLIAVLMMHGMIHLMGAAKAFQWAEIKELSLPISRSWGYVWLAAAALFMIAALAEMLHFKSWSYPALLAVLVSQVLVLAFWQDAKWGSVLNLILLPIALTAVFSNIFEQQTQDLRRSILSSAKSVSMDDAQAALQNLPEPVQRWVVHSGALDQPIPRTIRLEQSCQMKLKPEQENWMPATAQQEFTTEPPAFVWAVQLKMHPLMSVLGRDVFVNGKGSMLMKLAGVIPVVNISDEPKLNSGTMQRYLGEIVWFPAMALSPHIVWEQTGEHSAKARMIFGETEAEGHFFFHPDGTLDRYTALRYFGAVEDAHLLEWIVTVRRNDRMAGVLIPVEVEASWMLETGKWSWLEMKITGIEYTYR